MRKGCPAFLATCGFLRRLTWALVEREGDSCWMWRYGSRSNMEQTQMWQCGILLSWSRTLNRSREESGHHGGEEAETSNRGRLVVMLRSGEVVVERSATGRWVWKRCGSGKRRRAQDTGPCKTMSPSVLRRPVTQHSHCRGVSSAEDQ